MNATHAAEEAFRRLAIGDPTQAASMIDITVADPGLHRLDEHIESLLRIAALIAMDAPGSAFRIAVDAARRSGAGLDELLGVLLAVADAVGSSRVMAAAPRIALAAGYDVEAELEGDTL